MSTEKEIVGYKLKEKRYEKVASWIAFDNVEGFLIADEESKCNILHGSIAYNKLKESGVLDLWFEPVYKSKPTLEVGTWYILSKNVEGFLIADEESKCNILHGSFDGAFICYQGPDKSHYGLRSSGIWTEEFGNAWPIENLGPIEASDNEVEAMLFKECERRGIKKGVRINSVNKTGHTLVARDNTLVDSITFENSGRNGYVLYSGLGVIFHKGKWAEVVRVTELPTINGYKGEAKGGDTIKYGCAILSKHWFKKTSNRGISEIKLSSGIVIKEPEIEAIREYLKHSKQPDTEF